LLAAFLATACGGGQTGSPEDAAARQVADAGERLKGPWILVDYRPEVGLEPMLAQLLAMQVGHLTAQFDGTQMSATGIGVQATRTYRITQASGDLIQVVLYDPSGESYEATAVFDGDRLRFNALTPPWRGTGVLQRPR
jgi:hypothetical protein